MTQNFIAKELAFNTVIFLGASLALLPAACTSSDDDEPNDGEQREQNPKDDLVVDLGSGGAPGTQNGLGGLGGSEGGSEGAVCESSSSSTKLTPIFLGFAFDVSGSMEMGKAPEWWFDSTTKWNPIVEATSAFFVDEKARGIQASMALFPSGETGAADKCDPLAYRSPDVAMQELPSTEFSGAFLAHEDEVGSPLAGGAWRGGTPTTAVVEGTAQYLEGFKSGNPGAEFAIVLVTDGEPQGCEDNTVEALTDVVSGLRDEGIATYVIGIENPTTPPDELPNGWSDWGACDSGSGGDTTPCLPVGNLDALNAIAEAGGTDSALLIDTGEPVRTRDDFTQAINAIRAKTLSCELAIPEHPQAGKSFEKEKIDVTVTIGDETERLSYDPSCDDESAWRYDDENEPSAIELCPRTCEVIQAEDEADLDVNFLCEPRDPVIK